MTTTKSTIPAGLQWLIPNDDLLSGKGYYLSIATFGAERTGKTTFALSAPEPIGVIPLDKNAIYTMNKVAQENDRRIVMPKLNFVLGMVDWKNMPMNPIRLAKLPEAESKDYYRNKIINPIKEAYYAMLEMKEVRTVVFDTGGQLNNFVVMANHGRASSIMQRERGPDNAEMREIITAAEVAKKHLIMVHHRSEIYENDKGTGRYKPEGWARLGANVNVVVEHVKKGGKYKMKVFDCQANADLLGNENGDLVDDECTFAHLAQRVFPESKLRDWR